MSPTIKLLIALALLGYFVHCTLNLFTHFLAVMHLKDMRDAGKLTRAQEILGYHILFKGLVIDLVYHLIVGTVLFLDLPREGTLSGRLWRLSTGKPGWRQRLALPIRQKLLDSADARGIHKG